MSSYLFRVDSAKYTEPKSDIDASVGSCRRLKLCRRCLEKLLGLPLIIPSGLSWLFLILML